MFDKFCFCRATTTIQMKNKGFMGKGELTFDGVIENTRHEKR